MQCSLLRHGVHARDEKVRQQRAAADFQPLLVGLRGVEPVEQRQPPVAPQPLDDARSAHRHGVAERHELRVFGLHDGLHQGEGRFGVLHRLGLETVSPQRRGAGFRFFRSSVCHRLRIYLIKNR